MDRLLTALAWSGSDVSLSMFAVSSQAEFPRLQLPDDLVAPDRVRAYELEDDAGVLRGRHVYEHDLIWKAIPPGLENIVTVCLLNVLQQGAVIAWFGFEGSFDFEYLLHPDIATQIYAVGTGEMVKLALDDEYRLSDDWRRLLRELRAQVLS